MQQAGMAAGRLRSRSCVSSCEMRHCAILYVFEPVLLLRLDANIPYIQLRSIEEELCIGGPSETDNGAEQTVAAIRLMIASDSDSRGTVASLAHAMDVEFADGMDELPIWTTMQLTCYAFFQQSKNSSLWEPSSREHCRSPSTSSCCDTIAQLIQTPKFSVTVHLRPVSLRDQIQTTSQVKLSSTTQLCSMDAASSPRAQLLQRRIRSYKRSLQIPDTSARLSTSLAIARLV